MSSSTSIGHSPEAAPAPAAEARVLEVLERLRRAPEPSAGWVMRTERTSPLDTRHVSR